MTTPQTSIPLPPDENASPHDYVAIAARARRVGLPSAVELAALVDIGLGTDDIARYFGAPLADVMVVLERPGVCAPG